MVTHDTLPLRTVSRLTGLTPDIIRAWEKRHGVVSPKRGPRGARLYTHADVSLLRLLRQVVGSGRAIGDIAKLSRGDLETMVGAQAPGSANGHQAPASALGGDLVSQAVAATERFDALALDRCLTDALIALGSRGFIDRVAAPLLEDIGQRWSDGRLSIAEEHLLSGMLRNLLAGLLRTRQASLTPAILLATPAGERHEFGVLLAGLLIADAGIGLCYLGTDLPAAEIAAAARRMKAAVVGLGMVNGDNHAAAVAEIRRIERELPATTELWLGGRAAAAVARQMGSTRAIVLDQIPSMESELARLRALGAARI